MRSRTLLALALLLVMLFIMAGCQTEEAVVPEETAEATFEPIEPPETEEDTQAPDLTEEDLAPFLQLYELTLRQREGAQEESAAADLASAAVVYDDSVILAVTADSGAADLTTAGDYVVDYTVTVDLDAYEAALEDLEDTGTETTSSKTRTMVVTGAVNVRAGAGTGYAVIGVLSAGDVVSVQLRIGSWYKISYEGDVGYVWSSYLTYQDSEDVLFFDPDATTADLTGTVDITFTKILHVLSAEDLAQRIDGGELLELSDGVAVVPSAEDEADISAS